ncbi:MAG: hypothetical protein Q9M91_00785 [Candidatus Dojkabacteria bacterium]|nr:hypothetical protein [Candidatus Dojkabacteria bacterium]MDQ7020364.1 hypothetical protein [Candidatus Dojkabacteria bacterium]
MGSLKVSSNFTDTPSEDNSDSIPVGNSGRLRINKGFEKVENAQSTINLEGYNLGNKSISTHSFEGKELQGIATASIKNADGFWHYSRKDIVLDSTHKYTNRNMSLGAGFYIGLGDLKGTQVDGYKNDEEMKRYDLDVTGTFLIIDPTSDKAYESIDFLLYEVWGESYKSSRHPHIALNEYFRNNIPGGIKYDGIILLKGNGVAEGILFQPNDSNISLNIES